MLLFRPEFIAPILNGGKTQTRRLGASRWIVGNEYQAGTKLFKKPFAIIRVVGLRRERLSAITHEDARREGFRNSELFFDAWRRIHGSKADLSAMVWVLTFELVKEVSDDDAAVDGAANRVQ